MWKVMQVDNETLQAQLTQAEQQIAALQHKCQQLEDDKAALRQEMQAQQQSSIWKCASSTSRAEILKPRFLPLRWSWRI
jgi:multidrug resistance efflux pump